MDGVYSRYLPGFPEGGHLLQEVRARVHSGAVILSVLEGVEDLPPSRVTHMAIGSVQETFVNLTWTASELRPGHR